MSTTPRTSCTKSFPNSRRAHPCAQGIGNAHFAKLADEYHEINSAVHRAETNVEPVDQFAEEDMRKKRMALKDEIYRMLTSAEA
jgi:uncharacterized protein YdcH (DUF465 family)